MTAWNLAAIFNFDLAELLDFLITCMKIISILKGRFIQELFTKVVHRFIMNFKGSLDFKGSFNLFNSNRLWRINVVLLCVLMSKLK